MSMQADYDALPYEAMPFPQTQPSYLAALAQLHGCPAPSPGTARILELGCASGGNLIPLAIRYPDAVFEGFDLSERHVSDGRAWIAELGLENISICQGDIAALDLCGRRYDYIICHGVFSWTPPSVQQAILRICADTLSETGVAYISYNTLPGWHFQLVIRDICQQYTDPSVPPRQRIELARTALAGFARLSDTSTTFGKMLVEEISRSQKMSDSHFMGEFLSDHNEPIRFSQFLSQISDAGLSYMCDASPGDRRGGKPSPEADSALSGLSGQNVLAREQAMDIATGRTFRRSLLRRRPIPEKPKPEAGCLAELHFASALSPEPMGDGTVAFKSGTASLKTNDPVIIAALEWLAATYPETRSLDELMARAARQSSASQDEIATRLPPALLQLVQAGHVAISADPLRLGRPAQECPMIWEYARAQLKAGQDWVSSLRHVPVRIEPSVRLIALMLDGETPVHEIRTRIAIALTDGTLRVEGLGEIGTPTQLADAASRLLSTALRQFRQNALLVGLE